MYQVLYFFSSKYGNIFNFYMKLEDSKFYTTYTCKAFKNLDVVVEWKP